MKAIAIKGSFSHKIGDVIEKIGSLVTKTGAIKLGARIYQYGNKVEHKYD